MTDECDGMPMQPGPEHGRLIEAAGNWNVDCKFFMAPDQPPMETKGKETVTALGSFWTHSKFECDMMGQPFEGRCQIGFDPIKGKYISTWIDMMSPHIFVMEGTFADDGKTLTLTGEGPDFQGGFTTCKIEDVHHSPDHRTSRMYMGDVQTFEMEYRRA